MALLLFGLRQLAPQNLSSKVCPEWQSIQCWLSLAGFLLHGKLGCPELSEYLPTRELRAANGGKMFTDGNVGACCVQADRAPVVRGWCGLVTSFPDCGEPQIKPSSFKEIWVHIALFFTFHECKCQQPSLLGCSEQENWSWNERAQGTELLGQLRVAVKCLKWGSKKIDQNAVKCNVIRRGSVQVFCCFAASLLFRISLVFIKKLH